MASEVHLFLDLSEHKHGELGLVKNRRLLQVAAVVGGHPNPAVVLHTLETPALTDLQHLINKLLFNPHKDKPRLD